MTRLVWKRLIAIGLGLFALVGWTVAPEPTLAQTSARSGDRVIPTRNRSFRIPIDIPPQDRTRIREVRLYYSVDAGQSWSAAGQVPPDRGYFTFRAPRDAEYWFAVQTLDNQGRLYPSSDEPFRGPDMKVVVDTTPPSLRLTSLGRRGSRAGVRWEIQDEHLEPRSLVIQYREEGARDWRTVPIDNYALIGEQTWDAGTATSLLVHAWVDDSAGNRTLADLRLEDGIASAPAPAAGDDYRNFEPPPPIAPIRSASLSDPGGGFVEPGARAGFGMPSSSDRDFLTTGPAAAAPVTNDPYDQGPTASESIGSLLVGSPTFDLQYAVEDAGPSGPARVELWVTRDGGQTWSLLPEDADRVSPYPVNLGGEGTYGLWLVVQSASGLGDRPPRPGDRPQMWVEVDSQPPSLQLFPPRIGTGPNLGKVLISWQASDPHLAKKPILISYRPDTPGAAWQPIGGRLDNTGSHIWTVPAEAPASFHLRIDVIDEVGNKAWAETTPNGPILVDRSRPRGRILGLQPGEHAGDERQRR